MCVSPERLSKVTSRKIFATAPRENRDDSEDSSEICIDGTSAGKSSFLGSDSDNYTEFKSCRNQSSYQSSQLVNKTPELMKKQPRMFMLRT